MEQNGFNVEAIKTNDMYNTKVNAGIDMSLSSCHTGFIEVILLKVTFLMMQ